MPLTGQAPEFAYSHARHTRGLALFFAGSAIVHVLLAASLPHLRSAPASPDPLLVTLERKEPLRITPPVPLPLAPPEPPEPQPRKKPQVQKKVEPRAVEKPATPAPSPPVLALPQPSPQSPPAPEPSFTVPPREEKPPAAASEPVTARVTPTPESTAPPKISPPRSDAAYLQNPQPRYPMSARRRGEQGTVVLKVLVTAEGLAGSVSVQTSSGSQALDQAALDAVKGWRFVPARQGTQAVEGWHLVPIVFKLEGVS